MQKQKDFRYQTSDYLDFDTATILVRKLYREGKYALNLLVGCGIFFGLRFSDLLSIFDADTVYRVVSEYRLGVTKSWDVIFYLIDPEDRYKASNIMKYNLVTGHRIKDDGTATPITWVHILLKRTGARAQGWELSRCLFGEHPLKMVGVTKRI